MSNISESWLPVVDYEGYYEVSDQGRVRSLDRRSRHRVYQGRILKPIVSKGGCRVLHLSVNGQVSNCRVHVMVMAAFVGPKPVGTQVCHNNGDPSDNRLVNLRYDTPAANAMDTLRHGTCFQANKQLCPQGHPYDEANTRWVKTTFGSGVGRQCRQCDRDRQAKKRQADVAAYNRAARERRRRRKQLAS